MVVVVVIGKTASCVTVTAPPQLSVAVALVNTALVMPLDCVKTHLEKVNPTETYLNSFRSIYN